MYMARRKRRRKSRRKSRRRRRRRRRRTRRQRGGCTDCPLNMQANLSLNPSPVLPPGGAYEPGCTNGLRGGYYYKLKNNCPGGACHPESTVGKLWPGYDGQIEKWGQKKYSGGRRRRSRRRRSRRRRSRRRRSRRRNQRGGQKKDDEDGTPVGPGVGASIKTPPVRQFMGRMVTNVRKVTPPGIKNLTRGLAHRAGNVRHAYYGERAGASPDPMDQPRIQAQIPSDALDKLDNGKGGDEGSAESQKQPEDDVNINLEPEGAALNTNKKRFG